MTQQEAKNNELELIELLKPKYKDIKVHIDLVTGTDKINISLFWNRKSRDFYNDSKSYRIKSSEYQDLLRKEIPKLL
nr:hypothetical protein BACT7_16310 [Tenacibaculum mesophilum]